ncbi:MAG TPA: hypothetical protein V6D20_18185 [Candidatus Obscuribacterales bacterium]
MIQIWQGQTGELITEIAADGTTHFEAIAISHGGTQLAAIVQTLPDNALTLQSWQVEAGQHLGSSLSAPPKASFGMKPALSACRWWKSDFNPVMPLFPAQKGLS